MNQSSRRYSLPFMAVLAAAIVLSSGMPLMASPQQSGQSSSAAAQDAGAQNDAAAQNAAQKNDGVPETPQPQSAPGQAAQEQGAQTPSGAAGAKAAPVKGAPVAQPVGAAVAPVRQRGHRSLLIKIGLAAGAAVAVGTIVALSAKSPSRPPGASSSSQ